MLNYERLVADCPDVSCIPVEESPRGTIWYESKHGRTESLRVGIFAVRLQPITGSFQCHGCRTELGAATPCYWIDHLPSGAGVLPTRRFANALVAADSMSVAQIHGPSKQLLDYFCEQHHREAAGESYVSLGQWRRQHLSEERF